MSKLSQKELLNEGFLDFVRKSAGAIKGAVKSVGRDLLTMNPNANLFKSAGSGLAKGWKETKDSPEGFVENELRTKWSSVFDPKSVKITKKENASPAAHKSFKLSRVNRFFVYFNANRYKKAGGVESKEYIASIFRKDDGAFELEEIKDLQGNKIDRMSTLGRARAERQNSTTSLTQPNTQSSNSKPSWSKAYNDGGFQSGQPVSVADLAKWLENTITLDSRKVEILRTAANNISLSRDGYDYTTQQPRLNQIIGVILARKYGRGAGNQPQWDPKNITPEQINTVKEFFIQRNIFTESHKKTQLQLLESSYNLIYELPINKGN